MYSSVTDTISTLIVWFAPSIFMTSLRQFLLVYLFAIIISSFSSPYFPNPSFHPFSSIHSDVSSFLLFEALRIFRSCDHCRCYSLPLSDSRINRSEAKSGSNRNRCHRYMPESLSLYLSVSLFLYLSVVCVIATVHACRCM